MQRTDPRKSACLKFDVMPKPLIFPLIWGFVCGVIPQISVASSQTLYGIGNGVYDGSSNLYRIENYASSPTAVNIGETGAIIKDIAICPFSGRLFGIRGDQFVEIDRHSGATSSIGNLRIGSLNSMDFDASGTLFAWGENISNHLYEINVLTGRANRIQQFFQNASGDLAFHCDGFLYFTSIGSELMRVERTGDTVSVIGDTDVNYPYGLEIDPYGNAFIGDGHPLGAKARLYFLNLITGSTQLIGDIANAADFGLHGLAMDVSPPEPIEISGPVPGVAGQMNQLQIRNTQPFATVSVVYSKVSGATSIPWCTGTVVQIQNPTVSGLIQTDAQGNGTYSTAVARSAANLTFYIQIIDAANCKVSNLIVHTYQ